MLACAAPHAAINHEVAAGAHNAAFNHAHDAHIVALDGKSGAHGTVHGHITHKKDVASLKAHVLTYVEQGLNGNFAVKVKNIALGGSKQIAGITWIYAGVAAHGEGVIFKYEALVNLGPGVFKRHKLSQNLPGDNILDVAQTVYVGLSIISTRFEVEIIEIGIEVMPQIVLHHAPSVGLKGKTP